MTETQTAQAHDGGTAARSSGIFADVLCAVDGTRRSFAAVEQAATLAGPQGRLTLLAVTALTGAGAYQQAAIAPPRAQRVLARAVRAVKESGVSCTTVIDPAGPPGEVILERAAEHNLLALGAPVSSRLGGMLTDGVAVAALGSLAVPLLAARATPAGAQRFAERILVASDGTEISDRLIDLVGRLAAEQAATVVLLHAVGVESRVRPDRVQEQASRLDAHVTGASDVRIEAGDAAAAIVATAKETGASLVVAGSRGLAGIKALGSVSRHVVHEAHCSVLLVPPEHLPR